MKSIEEETAASKNAAKAMPFNGFLIPKCWGFTPPRDRPHHAVLPLKSTQKDVALANQALAKFGDVGAFRHRQVGL